MRQPARSRLAVAVPTVLVVLGLVLAACGPGTPDDAASGRVLRVPEEHASVQAAVDAASPGDLVLIAPGVYRESVWVATERIVIRGLDRDTVVLDGGFELGDGILVAADGVAIENLTVQRYRQNGVLISGAFAGALQDGQRSTGRAGYGGDVVYGVGDAVVDGYRVSYVTVANNGLYGLYAFAARNGIFEHSYASGHPDSGFYVGQCRPCNAVLRDLTAERNAIGYYGTNASGDVWVVSSVFRGNRLGIAPNSQDAERLSPQEDTWVVGNLVVDNDDPDTPEIPMGFFGAGIAVGGGTSNTILRNRIEGHAGAGIIVAPLGRFEPEGNTVRGNVLAGNGVDLVVRLLGDGPGTNCFAGNTFTTADPSDVEQALACDAPARAWRPGGYQPPVAPPGRDVRDMPAPPSQPSMPDAATAPARPAVGTPVFPDPDTIAVPARP
jgi:hypothetical protein